MYSITISVVFRVLVDCAWEDSVSLDKMLLFIACPCGRISNRSSPNLTRAFCIASFMMMLIGASPGQFGQGTPSPS